jgi:hypothetical protein
MFQRQRCSHTSQIKDVEPSAQGCEDCLRTGDTWMHLRECLTCGHVGCCDQSVPLQRRNPLSFRAALSRAGSASYSMGAWGTTLAGSVGG